MPKSYVKTSDAPAPIGPYNQGVVAIGKMVFTSGQIAIDPATGQVIEGDVKAQTRRVIQNMQAILKAAGSGLSQIVKTTVYLKNMGDFAAMNEVYGEFLNAAAPARSTVEVARLPKDVLVEIDCVALVESSRKPVPKRKTKRHAKPRRRKG